MLNRLRIILDRRSQARSAGMTWALYLLVLAVLIVLGLWLWLSRTFLGFTGVALTGPGNNPAGAGGRVVVYCAHDAVYAEQFLQAFETQTGLRVDVKFDTEATKSLGLVELIKQERDQPRCDVFWNNEMLGTMALHKAGLLEPYKGPGYQRIPDHLKDPEGHWTGFGARLRVHIVNTNALDATQQAVAQAWQGDLSRVTIAKPLYGTTLTHYAVLWDLWGGDKLKAWHREIRSRADGAIREVPGNAVTKNLVAQGVCDTGWTDTDDFFLGVDVGAPVAMVPVRVGPSHQVICIPNTAAIIKGAPNPQGARLLIEFLLSAETEIALANSSSRQIPVGPVDESKLPEAVRDMLPLVKEAYPLAPLLKARNECLAWLKSEYLQ